MDTEVNLKRKKYRNITWLKQHYKSSCIPNPDKLEINQGTKNLRRVIRICFFCDWPRGGKICLLAPVSHPKIQDTHL